MLLIMNKYRKTSIRPNTKHALRNANSPFYISSFFIPKRSPHEFVSP